MGSVQRGAWWPTFSEEDGGLAQSQCSGYACCYWGTWGSGQLLAQSHGSSPPQTPGLLMWLPFSFVCTSHMLPQCAQRVRNLSALLKTQEIQVQSLGGEDPLEKEMATHSSVLAWKIPSPEEPVRLESIGSQRVRHDRAQGILCLEIPQKATYTLGGLWFILKQT